MICEERRYTEILNKLNDVLYKFMKANPTTDYFCNYSTFLYENYAYTFRGEAVFNSAPYDAVSYVYDTSAVRFILRVWKNRKKLINYLETNFNMKRINAYAKNYTNTYYVLETDDINTLYTLLCMYTD